MANYEATKYDFSGGNLTGIQGVNTGLIVPWGDSTAPSGFLECDGSAVSRTTYADLFAVVSTTYGAGDGSTTFNLPDLTDRVIVSKSPSFNLASTGGANAVTTTGNVGGNAGNTTLSTPTISSHSHGEGNTSIGMGDAPEPETPSNPTMVNTNAVNIQPAGGGGAHSHPISANFTGGSDSVLQPFAVVMFIIKT